MRRRPALSVVAISLGALGLLYAWPAGRAALVELGRLLVAGDFTQVRERLRGMGPWAPLVTFALIQLQAVVAPLPSFPVVYASGFLFGTLWGGLLAWLSVLVSAALCFGLARRWGRPVVERLVSAAALRRTDALVVRYGALAVLLARLLPFTAFDLLSYAAGLTTLRLGPFLVATAFGMTPAIFLMAWAGDLGADGSGPLAAGTLLLAGLTAGAMWLTARWRGRQGITATADAPEG